MNEHSIYQNQEGSLTTNYSSSSQTNKGTSSASDFTDNSPEILQELEWQERINNSPEILQELEWQERINNRTEAQEVLALQDNIDDSPTPQKKNETGIPDNIKHGIESLSGISLDDVRVHCNSSKPKEVGAHAYAEGSNVYIASGKEEYLPHELWHIVQQQKSRVKATTEVNRQKVNDDEKMEKEAEKMGDKASKVKFSKDHTLTRKAFKKNKNKGLKQLVKIGKLGMEAEVMKERFTIRAAEGDEKAILDDPTIILEEFSLGKLDDNIDVTLDNEFAFEEGGTTIRSYTVEFVSKAIDVNTDGISELEQMKGAWNKASLFWKTHLPEQQKIIGADTESPDWFQKNNSWEASQFDNYRDTQNVSEEENKPTKLNWNGSGFTTHIDAKTEDPEVSMQITVGSILKALDAMYIATTAILAGKPALDANAIKQYTSSRNPYWADDPDPEPQPEALELLKLLSEYRKKSSIADDIHSLDPNIAKKRYQKEYINLMLRTSLDAVLDGMSEEGRNTFINWVKQYLNGKEGYIVNAFLEKDCKKSFFTAETKKEPKSKAITIAEVLLYAIRNHVNSQNHVSSQENEKKPGDAFSQSKNIDQPLAGFGEIKDDSPDQLRKYGINHAYEMMQDIKGVIAENRTAEIRKLSEMPQVLQQLFDALKTVEDMEL